MTVKRTKSIILGSVNVLKAKTVNRKIQFMPVYVQNERVFVAEGSCLIWTTVLY